MPLRAALQSLLTLTALAAVSVALALHAACSYPQDTRYGISIPPGSTSVPLDVEILLRGSTLPADALDPAWGVLLWDLDADAEVEVEVGWADPTDRYRSELFVRPTRPLAAGHRFELRGIDEERVLGWHGDDARYGRAWPSATTFRTGPGFRVLGAGREDPCASPVHGVDSSSDRDEDEILVVFSEPVAARAARGLVLGVDAEGAVLDPVELRPLDGRPQVLRARFPVPVEGVVVGAGLSSKRGGVIADEVGVPVDDPVDAEGRTVPARGSWPAVPLASWTGSASCR